ncbi:sodium/myo-inositol cotransporter 2-like [Girardinichthys multiradiatus]|uniref:sodium/myo-inositol cotransporter 2-like n=1 Tax=Girardinichthys multiradiatus TaxID=208333 RepID=UPI001FAD11EC|nr:sodium/myo-inositol cotransporter 2-like [Girardinichthys multiradiatus]
MTYKYAAGDGAPTTNMPPTQKPSFGSNTLVTVDIVVPVVYFLLVLAVCFLSMWRTKRSTVDGYFLAGKSMTWWPVGASLFASNIGSGHFIGLAGSGAAAGIGAIAYEWNGMFMVLLLGWLFLPIYISSGVTTMPEYLQKRFGGRRTQLFIAVLSLFIYIFTKISVDMYAGAVFIQLALKWNIYLAVVLLLAVSALYTVAGGLAAVIYTDAAQTAIMLAGALTLMGFSFAEVGGWDALMEGYFTAIPSVRVPISTCGISRDDSFHIFRDPVNSDLPWPGVIVGMSIPSMWYWCSDQVIVQRSLAAKTLTHAKGGSLLAAYLKVLPFFAIMLPGMISRILYTDEVACADPDLCKQICGNSVGCSDIAYANLVMELLPAGLRGLMMAVMIAALMSSLTSIFNSSSTIFTMDLWKSFRSHASEWELMIVGRVFVLVLVAVSVLWIPIVQASQGGQLFIYIQSISTYLQPPVSIIFLMGCFWKRTDEKGAFWGLAIGLTVGCIRMLLDFIYPAPLCFEEDDRPSVLKYVHYLYFSMLLSFITLGVVVVVSLATEEPTPEQISHLTWYTRFDPVKPKEQVIPVEQRHTGGDAESRNGQAGHQRRSLSLLHILTLLLSNWLIQFFSIFFTDLGRLCFICVQRSQSVQVHIRHLLVVWDGEATGGGQQHCDSSCPQADHLHSG